MSRNYYGRMPEGVQISGVNLDVHQKGKVIYVNNSSVASPNGVGASDNNDGTSPDSPKSTVAGALTQCVASRGDVIIIGPGHAETLADATTFAISKAGVRIQGIGDGALKPTFTLSAAGSQIPISAANCSLKGIRVLASASSVTAAIKVTAANVELDIETIDTDATHAMVTGLLTTAACSNLRAKLYHRGFAASSVGVRYVDLVGVVDADLELDYFGNSSTSVVDMRTTACADIRVRGRFYNDAASLSKNVTNNTTATWSVQGFDARAGQHFSGSTNQAVSYTAALAQNTPTISSLAKADVTAATAWTTGNSPVTIFTVTGSVLMRCMGVVSTGITSTSSTGTLALGVTGNTAVLIPQTTADGTNFATGDVWTATTTKKATALAGTSGWVLVNSNVILTIATNSLTAGGMTIYAEWKPVSAGATVV